MKFIGFVIFQAIGAIILSTVTDNLLIIFFASFFISIGGALNFYDLKDIYDNKR